MPADHLTAHPPYAVAAAVRAVLLGTELEIAAADNALDPADLADALDAYQAAGLAALERRAEHDCYDLRVEFRDWTTAEVVGATRLAPSLDRLQASGALAGWWFVRKHPCWRLRLHGADTIAVDRALDELTAADAIARWWQTIYEPETAAFGGPTAMRILHELFCADTRGVLEHLRHDPAGPGRRELSILLLGGLLHGAELDTFECGDVFDRVARLRPPPPDPDSDRIERLAKDIRALLALPDVADSELFSATGPASHAAPWLAALHAAGRQLGDAAGRGGLERGIRAILSHVVIFHWNRLGLTAVTQGILARAATIALLPR